MRTRGLIAAGMIAVGATAAAAADKPIIAPAPAWVKPVAIPADDGKPGEAAIKVLLQDQQVRLAPDGDEIFVRSAARIQTPQGLAAMGTIAYPWKPDTMTLTVNTLQILRGGKTIDILDGNEFTVLRRENSLEYATLDGVLTATIQPEGLQVGDVLISAITIKSADPALKGLSQGSIGGWPAVPIAYASGRVIWAADRPVRWRSTGGLPPLKESSAGGMREVSVAIENLSPPIFPKGAPARYGLTRLVEFTSARDWQDLSALFAPLYAKAATLRAGSPLEAEIARIRAASPDAARRAELALALVQDQVRYVFLGMNDGALVPASADQSWSRRFADCKGKTALLLALLHALDIEAEPAMVSSQLGDGLDQRLPMMGLFDHVIVRATIGGRIYWLDGTRQGDRRLADIEVPPFRWALPVRAPGTGLVRLEVQPPAKPYVVTSLRFDASKGLGLPAPAHVERTVRGDGAIVLRNAIANLAADARDRELKQFWKNQYDYIEPATVAASFDEASGVETLTLDGTAKLDWDDRRHQAEGSSIGYTADFAREPGMDHAAPYAVGFPQYVIVRETVILPNGAKGFTVAAPDIDTVAAGIQYRRSGKVADGAFVAETSMRSVAPEFPASEAAASQKTIRGFKEVGLHVFPPAGTRIAGIDDKQPSTAAGFFDRADRQMAANDLDGAEASFREGIALDKQGARGEVGLGLAAGRRQRLDEARRHMQRALDLEPGNDVAIRALYGDMMRNGRAAEALAMMDRAVAAAPDNADYRRMRGGARPADKSDAALADYAAAIRLRPGLPDAYRLRATLLLRAGRPGDAGREADTLIGAAPDDAFAQTTAGAIYARVGRPQDAERAFARSIAIKPSTEAYLTRASNRPVKDHAARLADAQAALKIEPESGDALSMIAAEQIAAGDPRSALTTLDAKAARAGERIDFPVQRAVAQARLGDDAAAAREMAEARKRAGTGVGQLNYICWNAAIANVRLSDALAACDAAIAISPKAAPIIDSRGFVLLRLGRYADAIAAYDAAIALRPEQAESLYGRAIAKRRAGDPAGSAIDAAAARKYDPQIAETFAGYGVTS